MVSQQDVRTILRCICFCLLLWALSFPLIPYTELFQVDPITGSRLLCLNLVVLTPFLYLFLLSLFDDSLYAPR